MSADGKRFYVKTMDGELLAIDTAPDAFRRLWITPAGFGYDYTACPVTVSGGIAYLADRSGNVAAVREDGTPVEGLYLTGDCSGGFFSVSYPNLFTGLACGRTMTFGRRAGMLAATGQA